MEDEILAQKAAERQAIKDFNIQVLIKRFIFLSSILASERKKTTRS